MDAVIPTSSPPGTPQPSWSDANVPGWADPLTTQDPFKKRDKIPHDSVPNSLDSSPAGKNSLATSRTVSLEDINDAKRAIVALAEESSLEALCRIYESLPIEERPLPTIWNRMKREVEIRDQKRREQEALVSELVRPAARPSATAKRRMRTTTEERVEFARLQQEVESALDRRDPLANGATTELAPTAQGIPKRGDSQVPDRATSRPGSAVPQVGTAVPVTVIAGSPSPEKEEGFLWTDAVRPPPPAVEPKSKCCTIL
ncbi:hypothetical protein DFJ74DRAFT_244680 [Hyaloraphidium curvatum]|nr:hypothetical protein DFJ74DRAFT_244680 [Hyaloraphidium curvatum]